jgi:hypothetical protein
MDEFPAAPDGAVQDLHRLGQRCYRHDFDLAAQHTTRVVNVCC